MQEHSESNQNQNIHKDSRHQMFYIWLHMGGTMRILQRHEHFKDARLVYNIHGKQTMDEVAAATGISKNMISDLENPEKDRDVGCKSVAKLADHYGVSIDWLMGLATDTEVSPGALYKMEQEQENQEKSQEAAVAADKYITITVAEYVWLVKAATLLETVVNDSAPYGGTLEAVKATVKTMVGNAEAGDEQ